MTIRIPESQWNGNSAAFRAPSEQQICEVFAQRLDLYPAHLKESLLYWTHVDNGQSSGSDASRKIAGGLAKRQGTKAGHSDTYFLYLIPMEGAYLAKRVVTAYIEFKTPQQWKKQKYTLEGEQLVFQKMCQQNNIPHAVHTDSEEAFQQLVTWGIISAGSGR